MVSPPALPRQTMSHPPSPLPPRSLTRGRRWALAMPAWARVEQVSPWVIAGLTMAHALTLCLVFMPYLDDQPVNAYSSQRGDAYDYVERAQALAAGAPLAVAMADRYRMPGYPLYLS